MAAAVVEVQRAARGAQRASVPGVKEAEAVVCRVRGEGALAYRQCVVGQRWWCPW